MLWLFFPKQLPVGFSLRKKAGRDMLRPRPRLVSALCPPRVCFGRAKPCPPCVRHAPALSCLPRVCLESDLAAPPNFVRHVSALRPPCVRLHSAMAASPNLVRHMSASCLGNMSALEFALSALWPRLQTVSAMCLPRVRLESALAASPCNLCPPCVRHVSACVRHCVRPCVHIGFASVTLSAISPPCLLSTMRPLKPWPCLWTLPAGKIPSHHSPTHSVYIVCPLVSFLHIFILAHQIRPSLAHPMLEKLFGAYAGITF